LEECLLREVREETGLEVAPQRLVGIYSSPDFDVTYPNGDQVQQFTACFECRVVGGDLRADGDESLGLAYFDPTESLEIPVWYRAMIGDFASDAMSASFRCGRIGVTKSRDHFLGLRRFVGQDPLILVGASGCVRDEAGRILLVRRVDDGRWSVPAGAMELGERIDATLVREVWEETGLKVEPDRVIGIYSGPRFFWVYPNGDPIHVVTTWFDCRIVGGSLRPDRHETSEARFFPVDKLPPLLPRHQVRIADALANRPLAVWW
jgi:8-oxo-dGTP pyrophosphatase MutT (NUDIX family)